MVCNLQSTKSTSTQFIFHTHRPSPSKKMQINVLILGRMNQLLHCNSLSLTQFVQGWYPVLVVVVFADRRRRFGTVSLEEIRSHSAARMCRRVHLRQHGMELSVGHGSLTVVDVDDSVILPREWRSI